MDDLGIQMQLFHDLEKSFFWSMVLKSKGSLCIRVKLWKENEKSFLPKSFKEYELYISQLLN